MAESFSVYFKCTKKTHKRNVSKIDKAYNNQHILHPSRHRSTQPSARKLFLSFFLNTASFLLLFFFFLLRLRKGKDEDHDVDNNSSLHLCFLRR